MFRLDSWEDGGDAVRLSGRGATACISEHKLAAPIQMAPSASCLMGIRAVFAPDGIVPDSERGIGADRVPFEWMVGVDRGKALEDVLSAGRMVVRETEYGVIVRAAPVLAGVDDLTLVDGEAGTVVSAPSKFERSKRPNHIVVRGNSERDGEFSAEAVEKYGDYQPAVYGWVTEEVSGDAVAGPTQALLVAQAELEKRARYSETVQVECVTDWRIKLDQTVSVTRGGVTRRGIVTGVEMPISGIGTMKLEIGVG
ncbi:hypothetical protein [Actinobaculum massiliense]|uniref:hypothetical protein n=1 Tax=Actinobaculum massiliense TaxID=202789 RepID=UPI0012E39960|nr:hypothetical protein [Actinobaculum massiliense]